jgi:hypothetical protein
MGSEGHDSVTPQTAKPLFVSGHRFSDAVLAQMNVALRRWDYEQEFVSIWDSTCSHAGNLCKLGSRFGA